MVVSTSTEMERVRHIATSWNGVRVAVGAFERRVAVWDVVAEKKISEFDTVLDFGGTRLAITEDSSRVVAGAYTRYGIACYEVDTGNACWVRKDLKKVQHLSIAANRVYCGFDRAACHVLDLATGQDVGTLRGVARVRVSPWDDWLFLEKKSGPAELRNGENALTGTIERTSFAFLSVAFSPEYLVTSESTGPFRCFALADAREVWRSAEASGVHGVKVAFDADCGLFQVVMWSFAQGGPSRLVRLDPESGQVAAAIDIPESPEHGFCLRGTRLLTWDGSLINTSDGHVVCKLPFPDTSKLES